MTSPAPAARRLPPHERRQQLSAAGAAVALAEGLEAVALRSLAGRAGVAYGLMGHYFDSADELRSTSFAAAVSNDLAATRAAVGLRSDPVHALVVLLARWVSPDRDDIGLLWLDAWSAARASEVLRAAVDRAMRAGHELVTELLVAGVEAGCFTCPAPDATAWRLLTLLDGQIIHTSLGIDEHLVDVRAAVTRWMEGELALPGGALDPGRLGP